MVKYIFSLGKKLRSVLVINNTTLGANGEFAQRIKHRHLTFWNSVDAEKVRNQIMLSQQSLKKWKYGKHWQRKLSNKFNAREFAKKHKCKVAELYWKGRNIEEINFSELPEHYVIRPTIGHSCQHVFLMANTVNLLDKKTYSPETIKYILAETLLQNENLEFLIEEFVRSEEGEYKIPDDYKIYSFNGQIAIIEVINRLSPQEGRVSYYDLNWNQLFDITKNKGYSNGQYQKRPACLNEILKQAKILSKHYEIFVRIDFYATDKGAVFGEFTPTPGSADFLSSKASRLFVNYWDSYCYQKI